MKELVNRMLTIGAVVVFASTLVGCNTVEGAGEDLEEGGEAIQETSQEAAS